NTDGEVEIGYGIYPQFQKKGYMTEAVGVICQWAFEQNRVASVLAETNNTNTASQKVLMKNGFKAFLETNKMTWWRLQKAETLAVERA
ncbi:MAG TPA: GNAT family N-acetyltransferase, partial [Flavisolibacter sp.]|nr:GNAT family N-acetyltransferase [Flavisolibacter sp.]